MNYENQRQNGPPEREYCRTEKKWGAVVDNFGRNANPNNRYRQHRNRHRHGHQQQQHQQNSRQQLSPSFSRRAGPITHDDRRMQHYHHNDNHRLFHNYDDVEEERQFDNKRHQRHHKYNSYHHNHNQNDSFHNYRQDDFSDHQHQYDGKGKMRTNQNYNTNIDNNNDRANNNNSSSSSNNNNIIGSSSSSSKKLDRRLQYRSPSNKKCLDMQHQRQRYQQQKQQRQGTLIELPYITNRKQHTNTSTGSDVKRRRELMGSDTKTAHFMSTNRTTATTTPKNVSRTNRWGPRINNRKHQPTLEQQQSKSKPAEDEPNFSARSSLDQLSQTFSQSSEITFGNNVARAKAANDSHVLSSPLNSEKKFSCLDCGVIFPKWMMCLHHMRLSHPKLELPTCQATKWQKKGHSVTTCPKTKQENFFRYGCPDNQKELQQRCLIVDSNKFSTSPSKYLKECNPSLLNTEKLKQGYRITNSKHVVKVLQRENVAAVTLTGLTRQTANTKTASISDGGDTSKVTENFEKALKDHQHQNQGQKTAAKDVIDLVSEDDSDDDCDDHDHLIQNAYSNDHVAKNSSNTAIIDASKKPNNLVNNGDVIIIDNDEISIIEILDDDDDDDDDDSDNGVEEEDEVIVLEQKKVIKREIERRIIDNNHDDNCDDAQIIGSTGKNALSDFPHSREDCVIYPLEEGDPMLYCQNVSKFILVIYCTINYISLNDKINFLRRGGFVSN